jgi:four helix bundle protein
MTDSSTSDHQPGFIPPHGGYKDLKSYQMSELVNDATVRFCDRFIDPKSRTHDQMVQAARSGNKNIAEGSQVSGTSRKMELKLVGVARASLEELLGDYRDFLRQRGLNEGGFTDRLYQARQQARVVPPRPSFSRNRTNKADSSGAGTTNPHLRP